MHTSKTLRELEATTQKLATLPLQDVWIVSLSTLRSVGRSGTTTPGMEEVKTLIAHGGSSGKFNELTGGILWAEISNGTRSDRIFNEEGEKPPVRFIDRYLRLASLRRCRSSGSRLANTNRETVGAVLKDRVNRRAAKRWKDRRVFFPA